MTQTAAVAQEQQAQLEAEVETTSSHRKSTVPSGVPLTRIFGLLYSAFPLSVSTSFSHWRNRHDLLGVQQELLQAVFSDDEHLPYEVRRFVSKNDANIFKELNEVVIPARDTSDKHVVFVHGYGAGLGFFAKNLAYLAKKHTDWNVHALDLPGFGCSSRPEFPHAIPVENHELVERLYTTPLREWFVERGLNDKNTIVVAHSMGAYLLATLGINEVNHKNHLEDLKDELPKPSALKSFFSKEQKPLSTFENEKVTRKFWNTLVMVSPGGMYSERTSNAPSWFVSLWNKNVSPFVAVRYAGIFGSKITSGWTSRRFSLGLLNDKEQEIMHRYSYSIFNARGSGEYFLNYLLGPGAFPRHPLSERIDDLANVTKRTLWMYGENDWMEPKGGILATEKLIKRGSDSEVVIVPQAGHHIYMDNFQVFNRLISDEMDHMDHMRK